MSSEHSRQLQELLRAGNDLADEFAAIRPSKPRHRQGTGGSNVTWRKRDQDGNIVPQNFRRNRSVQPVAPREPPWVDESQTADISQDVPSLVQSVAPREPPWVDESQTTDISQNVPSLAQPVARRELLDVGESQTADISQEVPSLDQHLQALRNLLSSVTVPASAEEEETPTMSAWSRRQTICERKFRAAMPELLNSMLAAETVNRHCCQQCQTVDAVVRCLDCVASGTQFLCSACDVTIHRKNIFHDREAMIDGFFEPIPPTSFVVSGEGGQHQLGEQVCLLPIPPPTQICSCGPNQDFSIIPGKQTVLVTINGPYKLCLPAVCCPSCSCKWTPGIKDLLECRYWPATTSCQLLYKFDVFTSFEQMKLASPALSQQAFLKMLEHRSLRTGRTGRICGDTFHRVFREFAFCNLKKKDLCLVEPFQCPACTPDMLAISVDGNRKHYRFKKSKGTDEPSLFEGRFIAEDTKVSAFVDHIRSQMLSRTGRDACGPATFTAGRETSQKSRAKVDEEGLHIAVCRHGMLLQGLNHYRGEVYAYPMFLQKELAQATNATFFCMDLTCRYWPYLERMAEKLPELQSLTEMKPFLSVMHAKAHTGKCEVRWGGRSQDGAGNTVGEEVEQVNSFLSRAALTTKYMTKSGRSDMITVLAMVWNQRKVGSLHKTLAKRFVKSTQRAEVEEANLDSLKQELNLSLQDTEQWVLDVKQWAATERNSAHSTQEELRREIDDIIYSLRRKKHDLYRQNDSNQTRQRKRRRIGEQKKKQLQEKILLYNSTATSEEKINTEETCSLSDDVILPWEAQGDVISLRLKRRLFDQVMLVRRLDEEKTIVVKEMTQHCQYLKKGLDKLDNLLTQNTEDLKNCTFPTDLNEEGYRGLYCCVLQTKRILQRQLATVTSAYAHVVTDSSFLEENIDNCEEEDEQDDSSEGFSEEEL